MKRAASGFSRHADALEATREALRQLDVAPHTLWVILSHQHASMASEVAALCRELHPEAQVLVGSGYGAISDRGESELEPGLAVLGIADPALRLTAKAVTDSPPDLVGELLQGLGSPQVAWLFLNSVAGWPESLASDFAERAGGALVSGGGVNGSWGPPGVAIGDVAGRPEAWVVGLQGADKLDWTLSQALAPQGPYLAVDRIVGDRLLTVDGRPAAEVARQHLGDERYAAWVEGQLPVFLRVPRGESGKADRIYSCSSLDAGRMAIFVPGLEEGSPSCAFAVLDGLGAEAEFRAQLEGLRGLQPAFAFYTNCCGRGLDLYGRLGVDADLFAEYFPQVPLLGLSSSFELAPRDGGARICGYTGILVLVS